LKIISAIAFFLNPVFYAVAELAWRNSYTTDIILLRLVESDLERTLSNSFVEMMKNGRQLIIGVD